MTGSDQFIVAPNAPITDRQSEYARAVEKQLNAAGIRVALDERNEKVNFRIREAQLLKIPFMLVVGDREQENGQVAVRDRKHGEQGVKSVADCVSGSLKKLVFVYRHEIGLESAS